MKRRIVAFVIALTMIIGFLNIHGRASVVNASDDVCKVTFNGNGGTIAGYETENYENGSTSFVYKDSIEVYCDKDTAWGYSAPEYGEKGNQALAGFYIEGEPSTIYYLRDAAPSDNSMCIEDYKPTQDVTLYAYYVDSCSVTIKGNGGTVYDLRDNTRHKDEITLYFPKGSKLSNYGRFFGGSLEDYYVYGYKNVSDGVTYRYQPGNIEHKLQDFIVNSDTTFEIVWEKLSYTVVVFKMNGGYHVVSYNQTANKFKNDYELKVTNGTDLSGWLDDIKVMGNDDPNKSFAGWKSSLDGKTYSFDEVIMLPYIVSVSGDVTFTAQWNTKTNTNNNTNDTGNTSSSNKKGSSTSNDNSKNKYSNEWVNGKWYNKDGSQTYKGTMKWKSNSKGWWIEDSAGWYPTSQWQKIDGKWYYFLGDGYMDYSEYRDGCWLGSDGAWDENYSHGAWHSNSKGWWYEDNGWYPANQWVWIDGTNYYFGSNGYWSK